MCSQIGQPLDRPQQIFLLTHLAPAAVPSDIEGAARAIVGDELSNLPSFCRALARGGTASAVIRAWSPLVSNQRFRT